MNNNERVFVVINNIVLLDNFIFDFLFIQDQEFVVIKVLSYFALATRFHEVHTNHNLLNLFVYNVFEFCF